MYSNLEYVITTSDDIEEVILESIEEYFLKAVSQDIDMGKAIGDHLDTLKDDLYFLVEYPYVDKVYRNSYYHYYASKHSAYQRDCIRVSIFSGKIESGNFLDAGMHDSLREKFFGYFILRPLKAIIGRSVIDPEALLDADFKICTYQTDCSVYGVKFKALGFPYSSQDGETITCAETTVWALMDYFGTKYPEYKPVLPSQIIETMKSQATERQLPSDGLTMEEVSFILKEYGFGSKLYSNARYNQYLFEIVDAYIESGIPVMTGLKSATGGLGHVVVLIGKQYDDPDFATVNKRKCSGFKREINYYDAADFAKYYVVQDDNQPPYSLITLDAPGALYTDTDSQSYAIDSVVIPLYPKIYLEAFVAKNMVIETLTDDVLGFDFKDDFVLRFFLASSRSFKSHIGNLDDFDPDLKNAMLLVRMPKFIWIAEIYEKEKFEYEDGEASGLIVLDATETNLASTDTLIFAAYPSHFVSIKENKFIFLQHTLKNYRYYNNLE